MAEELCLHAPFTPDDIRFLNRHVSHHGRTARSDAAAGARRVPLRIWLSVANGQAPPEVHVVRCGDTRAGALRGGAIRARSAFAA